jgi:chromosome segregation ATPase
MSDFTPTIETLIQIINHCTTDYQDAIQRHKDACRDLEIDLEATRQWAIQGDREVRSLKKKLAAAEAVIDVNPSLENIVAEARKQLAAEFAERDAAIEYWQSQAKENAKELTFVKETLMAANGLLETLTRG